MSDYIIYIIIGVIAGLIIGYLLAKVYFRMQMSKLRKQSVNKSRSVIIGQVTEQIAPLLPDFPYEYKDIMFLGKGVDYIVFDGLSKGKISEIIFLEIKSGKSNLNKNEKIIRNAVDGNKVSYKILRI